MSAPDAAGVNAASDASAIRQKLNFRIESPINPVRPVYVQNTAIARSKE
jgi:hypothetical protein